MSTTLDYSSRIVIEILQVPTLWYMYDHKKVLPNVDPPLLGAFSDNQHTPFPKEKTISEYICVEFSGNHHTRSLVCPKQQAQAERTISAKLNQARYQLHTDLFTFRRFVVEKRFFRDNFPLTTVTSSQFCTWMRTGICTWATVLVERALIK